MTGATCPSTLVSALQANILFSGHFKVVRQSLPRAPGAAMPRCAGSGSPPSAPLRTADVHPHIIEQPTKAGPSFFAKFELKFNGEWQSINSGKYPVQRMARRDAAM